MGEHEDENRAPIFLLGSMQFGWPALVAHEPNMVKYFREMRMPHTLGDG